MSLSHTDSHGALQAHSRCHTGYINSCRSMRIGGELQNMAEMAPKQEKAMSQNTEPE